MTWKILTTEETATRLGVSDSRVRQLVAQGALTPNDRSARPQLFEEAEVLRYERERSGGKTRPTAPMGPSTLFEDPEGPRPAAARTKPTQEDKGLRSENARLLAENRRLRRDLEQARSLVDALASGAESLSQVALALQRGLSASDRSQ